MRLWELASGWMIHLSEEETELVNKLIENANSELTDREEFIAQILVNKDVLIKESTENSDKFLVNYRKDVWRD